MISWPMIKYVLTAAMRDRLYLSVLLVVVVVTSLSLFMGSASVIEQSNFTLVFTGTGLRFAGVAGLVLFVCFYIRRAFETKDVEFLLSRPVSRVSFLLSHAAAFSILAFFVAAVSIAALCFVSGPKIGMGQVYWSFSLIVEFIIVANAALFFSMVVSSSTASAMAVFGLYVLARLMGEVLGIIHMGTASFEGVHLLGWLMQVVSLIVPRLDLMAQTSWLIYEPENVNVWFILGQGVIYSGLLIGAALWDLVRRQF